MPSSNTPNLALVGCGAIAQAFYLPAIAKNRKLFGEIWLADPGRKALAGAASILSANQVARLRDIPAGVELVIIATPNHLHYPLAMEAIERGAHVLIEKPFVIWPDDGKTLNAAAAARDRILAINQTRRLNPIIRELRRRISSHEFGALLSVTHREGSKLVWPFESGAAFAPDAQRTGVIMDFGVHVIDLYHYLLQPEWTFVSAIHDGFAGPEGLAEIELRSDDAPVSIRLSRYHSQENVAHLDFERAEVSFGVFDEKSYTVKWKSTKKNETSIVKTGVESAPELLLFNFLAACAGREAPVCDGASSLPVISVLDEVYEEATRYPATLGAV